MWPILHSLTASYATVGSSVLYARVPLYGRLDSSSCSQLVKVGRGIIIALHEVPVLKDLLLAYIVLPYCISRYRWDVGSIRSVYFRIIGSIALIMSMLALLLLLYAYYSANTASYSRHIVLPSLGSQLSCVYATRRI